MKRTLILLVAINLALISFGQNNNKPIIKLEVVSQDEAVKKEIIQIKALFVAELSKEYTVRLVSPDSDDAIARARNNELRNNKTSRDFNPESRKRTNLRGADRLCVVEITWSNNSGEYIFRADIEDTETGELYGKTALYPIAGDMPVKNLDRDALQTACRFLISRLGDDSTQESFSTLYKTEKRKTNFKAAGVSTFVPGLGLVLKGHNEGYAYLGAEAALCLGGVMVPELMRKSYINKRNNETNANNRDVYTSRANACRKISIISGTCAGLLHVANIVHSFIAEPKSDAKLHWQVAAIPVDNGFSNEYAMGLSLSYRF